MKKYAGHTVHLGLLGILFALIITASTMLLEGNILAKSGGGFSAQVSGIVHSAGEFSTVLLILGAITVGLGLLMHTGSD